MAFSMKVTPEIEELTNICLDNSKMDVSLYGQYDVKRGLRDINGVGVLAGLTQISNVVSSDIIDGVKTPCDGRLYYRGINVEDLIHGFVSEGRFGFEETAYLLLFGALPTRDQLATFDQVLAEYRPLPPGFTEDMILKAPSPDVMNKLGRSVLALYSYDPRPEDTSLEHELLQALTLVARCPTIIAHAFAVKRHYYDEESLYLHRPQEGLSMAENFLYSVRHDNKFTEQEARLLDLCLVLHAEHGGGNNSAFACRVLSSSGTDIYSAISAAVGSLKGPRHGGANSKVMAMMDDVKEHVRDWNDEGCVADYLTRILNKDAFDRSGLIYGLGHAVYTKTDPRCEVFRAYVNHLAAEKGREDELALYANVEKIGKQLLMERQHKSVLSTNIDFYSGFVYEMLGLPKELYTPLFAVARIAGWSAHRMEELSVGGKLIRPRYECVEEHRPYTSMDRR